MRANKGEGSSAKPHVCARSRARVTSLAERWCTLCRPVYFRHHTSREERHGIESERVLRWKRQVDRL
jgi:hypothetical protein